MYDNGMGDCLAEQCNGDMDGWRPKHQSISFIDKIKDALPKEDKKFSLDKLIDDHWEYIGGLLDAHRGDTVVDLVQSNYSNYKKMIEFHYKSAFRHGFKHALEHYGIEEKSDE